MIHDFIIVSYEFEALSYCFDLFCILVVFMNIMESRGKFESNLCSHLYTTIFLDITLSSLDGTFVSQELWRNVVFLHYIF
jgi:hypothetical protein